MFWQQATMSTKRRRVVRKHVRHPPAPEYEKAGAAGAEAGAVGASSSTTSPFTILTIASTALPVPPAIFMVEMFSFPPLFHVRAVRGGPGRAAAGECLSGVGGNV